MIITIILEEPRLSGERKVPDGAFGGITQNGENTKILDYCVMPYLKRFYSKQLKDGRMGIVQKMLPTPFKSEFDFYQPPHLREIVIGIFRAEGWNGESPLYINIALLMLMAPVFRQAFPEAQWVVQDAPTAPKNVYQRTLRALAENASSLNAAPP